METRIKMILELPIRITEKEKWCVASCPALDVFSQGTTREEARRNLGEALHLFLTSCIERGTLDEVLRSSGFVPSSVDTTTHEESLEDHIDIPLYLLAQFQDENQCRG